MKAKLPYYAFFTNKFGKSTGNILYALVAIVVVVVAYKLAQEAVNAIKRAIGTREQRNLSEFLQQQVYQTPDGVVPTTDEVASFEAEAQVIADSQHAAMSGFGTSTESLFSQLYYLEGWQLVMVAEKFGMRSYNNVFSTSDLNIFGWYDQELCDNCTTCLTWTSTENLVPGCSEEDDSDASWWCGGCTERHYMRKIWEKSGIEN